MKKTISILFLLVVFLGLFLYRVTVRKTNTKTPSILAIPSIKPTDQAKETVEETTNINAGMSLDIISPADRAIVKEAALEVKGKTLPGETVFVNEKELKADSFGNFSTAITLDEGENYIIIVANDKEGNYAERDLVITLESQ